LLPRPLKLVMMFAPLAVFFIGFAILAQDIRQPETSTDRCMVAATGTDVWPLRREATYIYKHGNNVLHDLALRCDTHGLILLNDTQLGYTPIKSGEAVDLNIKTYRYLPKRWLLQIHTGSAP
jgi:hypothetical protein